MKFSPWHQMNSVQQRMLQTGYRTLLTWFLLTMIFLYIIHSSNLFLVANDQSECSPRLEEASTEQHLQTMTNNISSSNSQANQEDKEEEQTQEDLFPQHSRRYDTNLKHIVFGIAASSNLWERRKEYIKVWWRPKETRGVVWLDQKVRTRKNEELPEIRISGNTAKFKYTNRQGQRSALRISRVVSETLRLGMEDVRWFVMGDDDTVFVVDNVVRVLAKYDHRQLYYVGSSSESHVQNIYFSYAMAYGGGGFAISYPLAKELEKMQDRCIQRYPGLYGSDDRIQACMAELGVPLTKEPGFHQYDVYGDLLGLLAAHPVTPLVSLHHLDVVQPIFPKMTRVRSLQHLTKSINLDSASIMQQSICYDKKRYWSISISWGYVVQILRGVLSPRELEMPTRTFLNWYKRADYTAYTFNTRPVTRHPCQKPFIFYMATTRYDETKKQIVGVYSRDKTKYPFCRWKMTSPEKIDSVIVIKRSDPLRWQKSPRRDCCRVLPSRKSSNMYLWVGNCRNGEINEL
ncbi:Beta-1,3-N-acetylglucosaminyltransferase lunatic fringe like [Quillaja saponaria]|uniref:Beta-1,3-N-acetylglucosaminyltransferase lunatic fringe like n=1 Tax=Quillaja saponaria TaxID=32244 RepID=A0AAD7PAK3_QUISA|nr:Beta-1,3-N-acetylglucosaminyltransferase lunatic fringe like [Quillaja saponaria]